MDDASTPLAPVMRNTNNMSMMEMLSKVNEPKESRLGKTLSSVTVEPDHNSSFSESPTGKVSGWLVKKNSKNEFHNRRFFIVEGPNLVYYESGTTFSRGASNEPVGTNEKGRIRVNNIKKVVTQTELHMDRKRWASTKSRKTMTLPFQRKKTLLTSAGDAPPPPPVADGGGGVRWYFELHCPDRTLALAAESRYDFERWLEEVYGLTAAQDGSDSSLVMPPEAEVDTMYAQLLVELAIPEAQHAAMAAAQNSEQKWLQIVQHSKILTSKGLLGNGLTARGAQRRRQQDAEDEIFVWVDALRRDRPPTLATLRKWRVTVATGDRKWLTAFTSDARAMLALRQFLLAMALIRVGDETVCGHERYERECRWCGWRQRR
jgi:hypothetical protein